jgi:xanthine phosphoribosyltransferase
MAAKSFEEIHRRLREIDIPESFDLLVAIASGGIIPGALLNERLRLPFDLLHINFRDADNAPRGPQPVLLRPPGFDCAGKRILLADARIKTGATPRLARHLLLDAGADRVKLFAINGSADYALFDEDCFRMPWRQE